MYGVNNPGKFPISYILFALYLGYSGAAFAGKLVPRIVNGVATQDEAATGALLQCTDCNAKIPFYYGICSGTLIDDNSFLTAAHCVCESNDGSNALTYSNCKLTNRKILHVYLQNGGIYDVSSIKVSPIFEFTNTAITSDFAVLTLSRHVEGITPAEINATEDPSHGTEGRIVGFGITDGDADDYGLKRQGNIITDSCDGADIAEPDNICWRFEEPLGVAGENSNTCSGDSGGPLFVDFGNGPVVAGVTSAGTNALCRTTDISNDSNVYRSRSFIKKAMGVGLDETGRCRAEARKQVKSYFNSVYNARKYCLDKALAGKTDFNECLNTAAAEKIAKAEGAISVTKLGTHCPADVILRSGLSDACASATTPEALKTCLIGAADSAAARLLDIEFADSNDAAVLENDALKCQKAIGGAAHSYFSKVLNAKNQCELKIDQGKIEECPLQATTNSIEKSASRLKKKIEAACPDAVVAALDQADPFGESCAGVTGAAALGACQKSDHDSVVDELVSLAPGRLTALTPPADSLSPVGSVNTTVLNLDRTQGTAQGSTARLHKFDVPPGVKVMRLTLNGLDMLNAYNDVDLYLSYQATPIPATPNHAPVADKYSYNYGVFEAIQVKDPAVGEWRALVNDSGDVTDNPYQLTVTLYK